MLDGLILDVAGRAVAAAALALRAFPDATAQVRGLPGAWATFARPLAVVAIVIGGVAVTRAQQGPEQVRVPGMGRTIPDGRGVIAGQVVEAGTGRPIAGARVEVRGSGDQVVVTTNQAGRYETRPLTTGGYAITVTAAGYSPAFYDGREGPPRIDAGTVQITASTRVDVRAGALVSNIDVALQATGHVSGRILDDRGRGLAGVYIELRPTHAAQLGAFPGVGYAQTDSGGAYRVTAAPGDYTVRAYVGRHVRPSRGASRAYVATFYPGVPAQESAQLVRVNSGAEQYDVDFPLVSTRTVRVSGTVVDPARDTLDGVRVTLRAVPSASGEQGIVLDLNARGEFDARGVAPGTYAVTVTDPLWPSRWSGARRQIDITDDVTDLQIRASVAASVSGRLVRDSRSSGSVNLGQVMVTYLVKGQDPESMNTGSLDVGLDGSFTGEVPTGPVTLSVGGPPHWRVGSILVDGAESFGRPFDIAPGVHEIEVVLIDRHSTVEGIVVDRRGTPLSGFDVVLFSADASRWYTMSPFVRQTRTSHNGRFEPVSLQPGDYFAVATERMPFLMIGDPEPTLRRLESIATRITVRDDEHKTISIRASAAP